MKQELLLSGIGGQGVITLGESLCDAAIKAGFRVTFVPFYGQEKRGGRTMCNITISDQVESPIISEANIVALGYLAKLLPMIPYDLVAQQVEHSFARKPKLIPINLEALKKGYELSV